MSVYIKGMEMPFTCLTCDFHKYAGGVGDFCSLTKRRQFRFKNRPKDCPLISVPEPHGALIDIDDFLDEWNELESYRTAMELCEVIPAREEGER